MGQALYYVVVGEVGGVLTDLEQFRTIEELTQELQKLADAWKDDEEGYANFHAYAVTPTEMVAVGWLSSGVTEDGAHGWDYADGWNPSVQG